MSGAGADARHVVVGGMTFDLVAAPVPSEPAGMVFVVSCREQAASTFMFLSDRLGQTVVGVLPAAPGKRLRARDIVWGSLHDVRLPEWGPDGSTATITCVAVNPVG